MTHHRRWGGCLERRALKTRLDQTQAQIPKDQAPVINDDEKFQLEKQLFDALDEESWSFAERNANEILESKDIKDLKKL